MAAVPVAVVVGGSAVVEVVVAVADWGWLSFVLAVSVAMTGHGGRYLWPASVAACGGQIVVIGSIAELEAATGTSNIADIHRDSIDRECATHTHARTHMYARTHTHRYIYTPTERD